MAVDAFPSPSLTKSSKVLMPKWKNAIISRLYHSICRALGVKPQGSGAFCAVTDTVAAAVSPAARNSFFNFMVNLINKYEK